MAANVEGLKLPSREEVLRELAEETSDK